ncbi:efflux RND transporter periplasmic adaptor subunit [bacterium]|mgnify:CR=1 FL=1|nr:efflux RND transporter periplasmic adaptor subunit [bacterium]MDB4657531.1 efflux RND transporter periplasmic adaptor subunit [Verrucomicrobiales bacterium]MDC0275776.1 efflux RND transporter periplasmic adaptor subunit [Verrucomicrobiales bacterium]MDC0322652.1 efflux RND transporter periplasmic adaptor subunit [Verrucomicrobiales bacterium]
MKKHMWWISLAVLIGVGLMIFKPFGKSGDNVSAIPEAAVQQGDLVIDVLEGGNIQALESLEVRNMVKATAGVKILEIADEGYEVTAEDVKNKKVLVRLDPSTIEEQLVDHDVQFQQTQATYAEAKQNLDIEESEALSDIKLVRQSMRFSLLDFEKFVGADAAKQILKAMALPYSNETLSLYEENATAIILEAFDSDKLAESAGEEIEEKPFTGDSEDSQAAKIDFDTFLKSNKLGEGEAEQTIRRMRDEALVAASELSVVEESLAGAERLAKKDFITKATLENERVNLEKAQLSLQTKKTELDLFEDYEFPKEAEKMLSSYEEALLELIREKREKMAKMSQVYAKYRSYKRRYELELKKRQDLEEQLASCVIYASKQGLMAYGGANDNYYTSRYYEAISAGATLKLGQPIFTIPDMSKLGVDVDIHESHIKKIERGQRALITAESVPDMTLEGVVTKVAVLPDSNASRYNPSLKVYPATIEIEGNNDFLKPGMTAKTQIIVNELTDILFIPVQAVFVEHDEHFVFLKKGNQYERNVIEIGDHNDEFIQILEGVTVDDSVALSMPPDYETAPVEMAGQRKVVPKKKAEQTTIAESEEKPEPKA